MNQLLLKLSYTLLLCMAVSGCGGPAIPQLASVEGEVTRNGKPVPNAQIVFTSDAIDAAAAAGGCDDNGRYLLRYIHGESGAPIGMCSVRISIEPMRPDIDSPAVGIPETFILREKYEVKAGKNEFNFKLEECGKPIRG